MGAIPSHMLTPTLVFCIPLKSWTYPYFVSNLHLVSSNIKIRSRRGCWRETVKCHHLALLPLISSLLETIPCRTAIVNDNIAKLWSLHLICSSFQVLCSVAFQSPLHFQMCQRLVCIEPHWFVMTITPDRSQKLVQISVPSRVRFWNLRISHKTGCLRDVNSYRNAQRSTHAKY